MSRVVMNIHVPEEIAHYEPELRYFFDSMVRKLFMNRHKSWAEGLDMEHGVYLIEEELRELVDAIEDPSKSQFECYIECVDVANTALLTGLVVHRYTRHAFDNERQNVQWKSGQPGQAQVAGNGTREAAE